jgi:hypothetical protein
MIMQALREVIEQKGMVCSLYSDRASHFFETVKAGESALGIRTISNHQNDCFNPCLRSR